MSVGKGEEESIPMATAVPVGMGGTLPSLDPIPPSADASATMRMQQLSAIGVGAAAYARKMNPLQGLTSVADATAKIRGEAKDLVNPTGFSKPVTRGEWTGRLSANWAHFRLSYTGMYALTLLYFMLTSPFLMLELAVIGGLWALFFKVNGADDVVTVGGHQLGRREKMLVLGPLTAFVAFFGGLLSTLFYVVFMGSVIVGAHASFRRPVEPDPLDALDAPTPQQFV